MLRVAIAPDAYIRAAKQREPYWSQADRAETVLALDCVDGVLLQGSTSVAGAIREYRPRYFVKGQDWEDRLPDDVLKACFEVGCVVVFTPTEATHTREARG